MSELTLKPLRIVLSGAPSSGKSTITQRLAAAHPTLLTPIEESATHLYHRLDTHWSKLDVVARRNVQRMIYFRQLESESLAAATGKHIILDRGTLDGAAYWPEGADDYWRSLGTSLTAELSRYDAVILLQSAAVLGMYDGPRSNTIRFETASEAMLNAEKLRDLWGVHPQLIEIHATNDFETKVAAVETAVLGLIHPSA